MNANGNTLQGKLQRSMVVVVLMVAFATLAAVSISSVVTARRTLAEIETRQTEALGLRGRLLGEATAQALSSLAADNAYSDIDRLLARVVRWDDMLVLAAYLTPGGTVWSYAGPGPVDVDKQERWRALEISVSGTAPDETRASIAGAPALVRRVPVRVDGEVAGILVLGLSTRGVQIAIADARHAELVSAATSLALMAVFILASTTLVLGISRRLARALSRPLSELTVAASRVADPSRDSPQAVPVRTSDGEVSELAIAFNTMVERVAARERALARNEAELQAILSSLPDTLLVLDEHLHLKALRSREGASPMPGLGARLGAPLREIVGERVADTLEPSARAALEDGRPSSQAVTLGVGVDALEIETFATRFTTDGRTRVLLSLRDVTARRRLEAELRQSQKLDALGRLAGGVAHDLNNLLMVVHTALELLPEEETPERRAEIAADALGASAQAARLVKDMLTFARKRRVELASVDLHGILERVARMSERTFGNRIKLAVELGGFTANVNGDLSQLESAILNLAVNARDAMPQGGTLTLRTTQLTRRQALDAGAPVGAEAEAWVRVDVSDTGVGIPSEILSRLFEPFFTTKEEGRGTGMGLAAVYGAVQAHQGTVLVDSTLGRGSTFSLLLPLAPPAAVAAVAPPARPMVEALNVMVVDDDPMVRAVVVRQLKQAGFSVGIAAGTAGEAEAYFASDGARLDVALLDVNMPDCAGPELATRLRGLDSLLPVVFMSGVEPNSAQTATLGDAFLAKPFSLLTLREALYAAANGERGSGRRRQKVSSTEAAPAPRRATNVPQNAPHKD
jgi:signal transduction histidine kinase/DNA-binding NarL/FixJ family response regulator/HAMP domain-containing protein